MIIDGRHASGTPETDYDLIVVGGGPAGISLVHELRDLGLRIALLESGGMEFDPDVQMLAEGRMEGNEDEFDLAGARLRMLGGTTNHWGGHCTPLDPIDFRRSPGNGLSGWLFDKEHLDPFYARANVYCDLGAYDYRLDAVSGIGPDDLLLPDSPAVETVILRQSKPTRFGSKYADTLKRAENIHVWLWTSATHLAIDPDGTITSLETQTLSGTRRDFSARAVVLAGGAIENARLLLASNARNETAVGNRGKLLGACYMDHPSGGAGFLYFDEPVSQKVYWSGMKTHAIGDVPILFTWRLTDDYIEQAGLPNSHYYVIPLSSDADVRRRQREAKTSVHSLKTIAKWTLGRDVPRTFELSEEYCRFITNTDSFVAQTWADLTEPDGVSRALLKFESEQRPDRSSFVALGDETDALGLPRPVLRWDPTRRDIDGIIETVQHFGRLCGEAGLARVQIEDHDADPYWNLTTAWHQLGTTRMAETETSGVVDANCRVFGTSNLYMAGGSVMPTAGRANPTLTIVALSIRLADHLASEVSRL